MYSVPVILGVSYVPPTVQRTRLDNLWQRTSCTGLLTSILRAVINISSIVCLGYAPLLAPRDDPAVVHAIHRHLLPVIIFRLEKFLAAFSFIA